MRKHLLHITYFLNFFFGLYAFSLLYINSTVLATAFGEKGVGIIYMIAALAAIGMLSVVPLFLRDIGDRRFTLVCILIEILAALGIAMTASPILLAVLFIIHIAVFYMVLLDLDVFLESASTDDTTGSIRGTYLTAGNIALVVAPVLVGILLGKTEAYGKVYLFGALMLLPAALMLLLSFSHFKDPRYVRMPLLPTFRKMWRIPALKRIMTIDWILRFFYTWMVIYMPLYLHGHVGLPWDEIGLIFTIMLIPFPLFELPLGIAADRKYGEKELLIIGLFIMGGATLVLAFIASSSFLVWATALFITRVGAAMVEVMAETYFFKHVTSRDTDMISFFRSAEPFAYASAPLLASFVLVFAQLPLLFVILAVIVLSGIPVAVKLVDTR